MVDMACECGDFKLEFINHLQEAVGDLLDAQDAQELEAIVRRTAANLPAPRDCTDRLFVHDRLSAFARSAGRHLHGQYHLTVNVGCDAAALYDVDGVWSNASASWIHGDPRQTLTTWAGDFRRVFERTHPWPAEVQVAMRLRRELRHHISLEHLARAAGVSRSVLVRKFARTYGMSVGAYRRQSRVEQAVRLLRSTSACIDSIARDVGYRSTKNLYAAVRRELDLTPDQVRRSGSKLEGRDCQQCRGPRLAASVRLE